MLSVSVAMATYNGARYLPRQLASLAAQSYAPAELVVVDDGSNDETLSIVAAFAKDTPFPVRIHRNEIRLGYRGNFMRVASLCNSDLIAFCDQDDDWYPHKLEACVELFSEPDILFVYHNANVVTENSTQIGSFEHFGSEQRITLPMTSHPFSSPFAHGFTQVFRRWMTHLSHLWPTSLDHWDPGEPMAHDQWFFFLASVLGRIIYLDEPLVGYIQHEQNAYGWRRNSHSLQKLKSFLANPREVDSYLSQCLERRGIILESAQAELNDPWRERAQIAAKHYRRLSQAYAQRSSIYRSTKFGDRLKAFRELLAKGGYERVRSDGQWSLGLKSFVKDLCLGVAFGPFLKPATNEHATRLQSFNQQSKHVSPMK